MSTAIDLTNKIQLFKLQKGERYVAQDNCDVIQVDSGYEHRQLLQLFEEYPRIKLEHGKMLAWMKRVKEFVESGMISPFYSAWETCDPRSPDLKALYDEIPMLIAKIEGSAASSEAHSFDEAIANRMRKVIERFISDNPQDRLRTRYRPHRGSLSDSIADTVEVDGMAGLVAHLRSTWPYSDGAQLSDEQVKVRPYGGDDPRCGWKDVHIVLIDGSAIGFCEGPIEGLGFIDHRNNEDYLSSLADSDRSDFGFTNKRDEEGRSMNGGEIA
jgi:hypothetical protein